MLVPEMLASISTTNHKPWTRMTFSLLKAVDRGFVIRCEIFVEDMVRPTISEQRWWRQIFFTFTTLSNYFYSSLRANRIRTSVLNPSSPLFTNQSHSCCTNYTNKLVFVTIRQIIVSYKSPHRLLTTYCLSQTSTNQHEDSGQTHARQKQAGLKVYEA
jgi:hypothetical protein